MRGARTSFFRVPSGIALLIAAFVVLGGIYSVVTPLFEASDELWHYPMVQTLADGHGLPVQDPAHPGPWRQEGSQPPLYYAIGALATSWINTSDIDQVRRLNPHADNGVITEDGNNNIVVHNAAVEKWPWTGTTLAVHLVRFLSVLMGAGTVYFTYLSGLELFPDRRWLALAGAAMVAFTPMFLFISGSVNNDNLGVMLSTVAIWMMLVMLRLADAGRSTLKWTVALGICLGMAALSKQSTLGLFLLAALTISYAAWRLRTWRVFFVEGAVSLGLVVIIAGWWYWRNWVLYQDPSGLNTFLDIVGRRSPPASLLQLWGERVGFVQSYWGLFGGVSVPMAGWAYTVFNTIAALGITGAIVFLIREFRARLRSLAKWAAYGLTLVWIPAVVLPLIFGWTRFTLASQGRLIFSAIGAISLWLMAGLGGNFPARWGKAATSGGAAVMGVIAVVAPFVWIGPHYQVQPVDTTPQTSIELAFTPAGAASPAMKLTGYSIQESGARPGDTAHVTLYWESLTAMDRDWSVFVHLVDSADLIQAQRDTYPGMGLLATSDLTPGRSWADRYAIPISGSAYSPEKLRVIVGIYDLHSGQRMKLKDGTDSVTLGTIDLKPAASDLNVPNPVDANFGNQLRLVGYSLDARRVKPGDPLSLHLYWRAEPPVAQDYTLSVQVFDVNGDKRGQLDQPLSYQNHTTKQWAGGVTVETTWAVPVAADAAPGTASIQLIAYWSEAGGNLDRLQLVTADGRLSDPFLTLAKVQIAP